MENLNRHCFALDLVDDEKSIQRYETYHKNVWPEVLESIKQSGIAHMEIYRVGNRLFMVMEVYDSFSFEEKQKADEHNPKVREWEKLMWKFQKALPFAKKGEKWIVMEKIFNL